MRAMAAALALAVAGGCTTMPVQDAGSTYYLRDGMVNGINPHATLVWDMQVEVMNDAGDFDPALMSEANWAALIGATRALEAEARRMASATRYLGADPRGHLGDPPEGTDLAAIEARIAANLPAYRALALSFAGHAGEMARAASARNAPELSRLANELQPHCAACHEMFWFPADS